MDLAHFYSLTGVLMDTNGDGLPDRPRVKVVLGDTATVEEGSAAVELSGRLGLEVMGLDLPLAVSESNLTGDEECLLVVGTHNGIYDRLLHEHPHLWAGIEEKEGLIEFFPPHEGRSSSIILVAGQCPSATGRAAYYLATALDPCAPQVTCQRSFHSRGGADVTPSQGLTRLVVGPQGDAPIRREGGPADPTLCLTRLWSGLLRDEDGDGISESCCARLVLPSVGVVSDYLTAANWAARLGLEAVGLNFPLALRDDRWLADQWGEQQLLVFGRQNRLAQRWQEEGKWQPPPAVNEAGVYVVDKAFGHGSALLLIDGESAHLLPGTFPGAASRWQHLREQLSQSLGSAGTSRAAVTALQKLQPQWERSSRISLDLYLPEADEQLSSTLAQTLGGPASNAEVRLRRSDEPETVFSEEQVLTWEVDEAISQVRALLEQHADDQQEWELELRLSETKEVRDEVALQLQAMLGQMGLRGEAKVLSAHKQGYSWLKECVLPQWQQLPISQVIIECSQFQPNPAPWIDIPVLWLEQGKPPGQRRMLDLPGVMQEMAAHKEKWLGLPVRWLCELYPIDEELARSLHLPVDNIQFELVPDLGCSYRVRAKDSAGRILWREDFTCYWTEGDYLQAFPEWGRVQVESAWLKVRCGEQLLLDAPLLSDLAQAWQCFQRFLVRIKDYLLEAHEGKLAACDQPLFHQLVFESWLSEPDQRMELDEELFSTLEALHEDIYFVALDFFNALGVTHGGQRLEAPGQIIPRIHRLSQGAGRVRMELTGPAKAGDRLVLKVMDADGATTRYIEHLPSSESLTLRLEAYEVWGDNEALFGFQVQGTGAEELVALLAASDSLLTIGSERGWVRLRAGDTVVELKLAAQGPAPSSEHLTEVPRDSIIDQDTNRRVLAAFAQRPEVAVWSCGRSLQGREILAVALTLPTHTQWRSQLKTALLKPTYHLNNRHHANEVSATNAVLWLVEHCLEHEEGREWLKRINLCAIPMENADGAALHYELQTEHPNWMLHAARYNAVGLEFSSEYHHAHTRISEARALPANWQSWLPDLMVDCHERPSHEWRQLFAGYTPVSWPYLWILPSFFTGIMHYVQSEHWPHHRAVAERVRDAVVTAINGDQEIAERNRRWQRRYQKYAHAHLPEKFPKEEWKGVQFHFQGVAPSAQSSSFTGRHPQITALNWVTEVAAETPQGEFLRLCARTHVLANQAVMALMASADYSVERYRVSLDDGSVRIAQRRPRPLQWED